MELHANPVTTGLKASRDWAQTQRTNLKRLIDSVVARRQFEPKALTLARKIQNVLDKNEPILQPVRESSVTVFARLSDRKEGLSLQRIAAQALQLFQATVDGLQPKVLKKIGTLSGLSIAFENRPIRKAAKEIDAMAKLLQADPEPEVRLRGQALWLSSRLLSVTAPPADQFPTSKCVFCHRYTTSRSRSTCKVHRFQGRYTAALSQRGKFATAMENANRRFEAHVKKFPQDLMALDDPTNDAQAIAAVNRLAASVLDAACRSTLAIAIDLSGGDEATLSGISTTWHALAEVDDEDGLLDIGQSDLGLSVEFMEHLIRFDAFLRMGGDVKRRLRVVLSEGSDIQRIFGLRDEGKTQVEVAKAMGISLTQLRRIERDHGPSEPAQPAKEFTAPRAPRRTTAPGAGPEAPRATASKATQHASVSTKVAAPRQKKPPRPLQSMTG